MATLVYHASNLKMEFPGICKQRYSKDFSWGVYCTFTKEDAERNAQQLSTPVINIYELYNIDSLNVKKFNGYSNDWLDFVISCRSGHIHGYDIVIGPIANDTVFDYIAEYQNKILNTQRLFQEMRKEFPNPQISLHTIKALDYLKFYNCYYL